MSSKVTNTVHDNIPTYLNQPAFNDHLITTMNINVPVVYTVDNNFQSRYTINTILLEECDDIICINQLDINLNMSRYYNHKKYLQHKHPIQVKAILRISSGLSSILKVL